MFQVSMSYLYIWFSAAFIISKYMEPAENTLKKLFNFAFNTGSAYCLLKRSYSIFYMHSKGVLNSLNWWSEMQNTSGGARSEYYFWVIVLYPWTWAFRIDVRLSLETQQDAWYLVVYISNMHYLTKVKS